MTRILSVQVHDVRFPTAAAGDGSDAINRGDYSATYVELLTDGPLVGTGFTFTNGRGNELTCAAVRALAPEPRVLLLDEPLSNLDPSLRERTRRELQGLIHRVGITTVIVTHEQEEAFDLGDRVAVLRQGRMEQAGTPDELYNSPANAFVAGFVGWPRSFQN